LITVEETKRTILEKIKKDEETPYPNQVDLPGDVSDDDFFFPEAAEVLTCLKVKRACPPGRCVWVSRVM